jgi:hypothetical protein
MIDPLTNPWERRPSGTASRDGQFYVSGTSQELTLVFWRGIKDSEIDNVIRLHNEGLKVKEDK